MLTSQPFAGCSSGPDGPLLGGGSTFDSSTRTAAPVAPEVRATVASTWATAEAGEELTLAQRARIRGAATWVTAAAAAVVDTAYTSGGGSALYSSSPLQRRLRDIHAIAQHFALKQDTAGQWYFNRMPATREPEREPLVTLGRISLFPPHPSFN